MAGYMPKSARPLAPEPEAQQSYRPPSARPVHAQPVQEPAKDEIPPQLARPVGAGETFILRAVDALPLGRPLVSALTSAGVQTARAGRVGSPGAALGPASIEALRERGIEPEQPQNGIGDFLEEYRRIRDERDVRSDVGSAHNPWSGRTGTGTGIAASMLVPLGRAAQGPQSLARMVGTGAALGGLQAAGDSRADLTRGEVGRQALDTAFGSALGAGGGVLGAGLAKATPHVMAWARELLGQRALDAGRRALLGGADSLSGRVPISDAAVRGAIDDGAIVLGGSTQGTSRRLDALRQEAGDAYGAILDQLEAAGVRGPPSGQVADALRRSALEAERNTIQSATPAAFRNAADNLPPGLVGVGDEAGTLGLRQAEAVKRSAQDVPAYQRLMQNSSEVNEANKRVASIIRQANEDAVEAAGERMGGEVRELADTFVPLKQRMGRLIEASDAAERGAAAASRRSSSSLSGTLLAAGKTGNPVTDDLLSRVLTAYRGRVPSTEAVMSLAASRQAGRMSQDALTRYILGTSSARGSLGAGLLAGDVAPSVGQSEEAKSRYEALRRALSGGD